MNFRLVRDQVVLLEITTNLFASRRKGNMFGSQAIFFIVSHKINFNVDKYLIDQTL